ncbi:MAG: LytTR family DNA-binding domain-containing protein [Caulobacterales bacterium]
MASDQAAFEIIGRAYPQDGARFKRVDPARAGIGTSGRTGVISGLSRMAGSLWPHRAHLILSAIAFAVIVPMNATTQIMDAARVHWVLRAWEPFVWEGSSVAVILMLSPLIARAMRRWPLERGRLARGLAVHLGLTIPFSLVHVSAMVALRHLAYAIARSGYDFGSPSLPLALFYEWRKDAVTYGVILAIFWVLRRLLSSGEIARAAAAPGGFEVRDGAGRLFIHPQEILWVEAAGNYLHLHTTRKSHFVRGVLGAWAARLAPFGFARIHRSRLVNCERIRAISPTETKDFLVTLDDGQSLRGSRRFRAALETGLQSRIS